MVQVVHTQQSYSAGNEAGADAHDKELTFSYRKDTQI